MQEKKFVKSFRTAKIIQFCILLMIEIVFFIILLSHPSLSKTVYNNRPLFMLCSVIWVLMILHLVCLLSDFIRLRSFALESHALNKAAYLDDLTGIPNRHGLDVIFRTYDSPESMESVGCFITTIDNLVSVNKTLGRETGNAMIQAFSSILEKVGDTFGTVGRNGGNEFICVLNRCTEDTIKQFTDCLNAEIDSYNSQHTQAPILLRSAYVLNSVEKKTVFSELMIATYNKLHS